MAFYEAFKKNGLIRFFQQKKIKKRNDKFNHPFL